MRFERDLTVIIRLFLLFVCIVVRRIGQNVNESNGTILTVLR